MRLNKRAMTFVGAACIVMIAAMLVFSKKAAEAPKTNASAAIRLKPEAVAAETGKAAGVSAAPAVAAGSADPVAPADPVTPAKSESFSMPEDFGAEFLVSKGNHPDSFLIKSIPMRARIFEFVKRLQAERVEESVKNLSEVTPFYWPGVSARETSFSVPERSVDADAMDIQVIASNRRFLKLLDDLKCLSQQEASALVSNEIDNALEAYSREYAKVVAKRKAYEATLPDKEKVDIGMSFVVSDVIGKPPTLLGRRYEILSLALLSGNLKLTGCRASVERLAVFAQEQYEDLIDKSKSELSAVARNDLLRRASLYSRQVLATALVGVSEKPAPSESKEKTVELTKYDAAFSTADMFVKAGLARADFTKGKILLVHLNNVNDAGLESLMGKK